MASIKKYKKASGHGWRVQYRSPDGKSRTKQGFRTKDEAQAWADINAASIHTGDWVKPEDKTRTVNDLSPMWLARVSKRAKGTQRVYLPCWEQHVQPMWGARKVGSIKPSEVQAWADSQTLGAVMVTRMVNILAQVLDPAVKDGVLKSNPARNLDLPKKPAPKQVYLTAEQLARLAGEAKYPEIVWVLGTVGLRWGELAGLRVRNVNVLRSRLTIEELAAMVFVAVLCAVFLLVGGGFSAFRLSRHVVVYGGLMPRVSWNVVGNNQDKANPLETQKKAPRIKPSAKTDSSTPGAKIYSPPPDTHPYTHSVVATEVANCNPRRNYSPFISSRRTCGISTDPGYFA